MNRYQVHAVLKEKKALRYTPAGVPAVDLIFDHQADQPDGHDAMIEFSAVAFGLVAEAFLTVPLGSQVKLDGFLRHSAKSKKLIVQVKFFEII